MQGPRLGFGTCENLSISSDKLHSNRGKSRESKKCRRSSKVAVQYLRVWFFIQNVCTVLQLVEMMDEMQQQGHVPRRPLVNSVLKMLTEVRCTGAQLHWLLKLMQSSGLSPICFQHHEDVCTDTSTVVVNHSSIASVLIFVHRHATFSPILA